MMHGWAVGIAIRVITHEINTASRYLNAPQKKSKSTAFYTEETFFITLQG